MVRCAARAARGAVSEGGRAGVEAAGRIAPLRPMQPQITSFCMATMRGDIAGIGGCPSRRVSTGGCVKIALSPSAFLHKLPKTEYSLFE